MGLPAIALIIATLCCMQINGMVMVKYRVTCQTDKISDLMRILSFIYYCDAMGLEQC